jgi:glycosyltransferase involved in cell wall biosynthesis
MALAEHHEMTLVTFAGPDLTEKEGLHSLRASGIKVHYVWRSESEGLERWKQRWRLAHGWLSGGRPLRTLLFTVPKMQHLIDRLLPEQQFDLLQIEDNAMGNYLYKTQLPMVLTEHEVRSADEDYRLEKASWIQQVWREGEQHRWLQYQSNVWRRFDRIQVFTPRDAATIKRISPEIANRVRVNSFGVNLPAAANPYNEDCKTIVFVGGFLHPPNVDAALWLGNEIMPRLRMRWSGVRLIIVGSDPPIAVQALAAPDIIVTGRVPVIELFLEQAAVIVAPLRLGGGMRVKVLQAMALGKAVVTTPLGAEGLATNDDCPIVIAEDAEQIASAIARLLAMNEDRQALGRRARDFVIKYHNWSAFRQRLETIYAELLSIESSKEAHQQCAAQ